MQFDLQVSTNQYQDVCYYTYLRGIAFKTETRHVHSALGILFQPKESTDHALIVFSCDNAVVLFPIQIKPLLPATLGLLLATSFLYGYDSCSAGSVYPSH